MSVKKLVYLSIYLALSVIFSYVESLIPLGIPGVKLGLANVIILILLVSATALDALVVLILRIFIVALIRGSILTPTFYMSLFGGLSAYLAMFIFTKIKLFSLYGISTLGSVCHTIGQIVTLGILLGTSNVTVYFPIIGLLSIVTGIFSGFLAIKLLKRKDVILPFNE